MNAHHFYAWLAITLIFVWSQVQLDEAWSDSNMCLFSCFYANHSLLGHAPRNLTVKLKRPYNDGLCEAWFTFFHHV